MSEYNYDLYKIVRERFKDVPPMYNGVEHPADAVYKAVWQKWPQINYKSRIRMITAPFLTVAEAFNPPPTLMNEAPRYRRRPGKIAWLWRFWYEIMVRVIGPDDIILKERGWWPEYAPLHIWNNSRTIELEAFGMYYNDFWGGQRHQRYIEVGYDPLTDTVYIRE